MDLVFSRTKKIPSKSWGQECSLCSSRHGVPIECSARGCKAAYHTTCAIRSKLKMQAIFGKKFKGGIKLRSYCKNHSPALNSNGGSLAQDDKIDASGVKEIDMTNLADDRLQSATEELDFFWKYVDINEVHKNISEAYARETRLKLAALNGDNSVPESSPKKQNKKSPSKSELMNKSDEPSKKTSPKADGRKRSIEAEEPSQIVDPLVLDLIYRYWMLLRTANNGQSLIKFSPTALKEREFEQRKSILKLRIELERVRNLSYMISKREKMKASWLKSHQNIIRRTFSVINELHPPIDVNLSEIAASDGSVSHQSSAQQSAQAASLHAKKSSHQAPHVQPTNGLFNESDQLINDLITCDQIYEPPDTLTNSNHGNLSYQERSTLERRRTLSLVRRINRQLKSVCAEPSLNPYAKNYLLSKRSNSPTVLQQQTTSKILKYK